MSGLFFALEGIDGSGKSTQTQALQEKIQQNYPDRCYFTAQPSKGDMGLLLRQYLTGEKKCDPRALAHLFSADRLDHILCPTGLLSQVEKGKIILCDRYYFSSFAYQALDLPLETLISANAIAMELLPPTATFFIDVPPDIAVTRIAQRQENMDLFESQEQLEKIYENYKTAFARFADKETIYRVNGCQSPAQVTEEIYQKIVEYL